MNIFDAIIHNRILIAGVLGWATAQVLKLLIHLIVNRKLSWERLIGDGGMPSAHSATVTAVAATAGMECGFDSPVFAVAAICSGLVDLIRQDRFRADAELSAVILCNSFQISTLVIIVPAGLLQIGISVYH